MTLDLAVLGDLDAYITLADGDRSIVVKLTGEGLILDAYPSKVEEPHTRAWTYEELYEWMEHNA